MRIPIASESATKPPATMMSPHKVEVTEIFWNSLVPKSASVKISDSLKMITY